ncbi:uncharacterized protein METZ01_LOCUS28348 [marine metagenome]|uniref:Uncharacterized protein n=1 Tax=marine metagenome TaxID=408172 RepID=A0A381Q9G4_9ZZZZ
MSISSGSKFSNFKLFFIVLRLKLNATLKIFSKFSKDVFGKLFFLGVIFIIEDTTLGFG